MIPNNIIRPVFYFGYSFVFGGCALKFLHIAGKAGNFVIITGMICIAIFIIMALSEIYRFRNMTTPEKLMWTVGFLFFNMITGLLYFFSSRKRLSRNYKLSSPYSR